MNRPLKILFLLPALSGGGAERAIIDVVTHLDSQFYDAKIGVMSRDGDYSIPDSYLLCPLKDRFLKKPSKEKYTSIIDGLRYLIGTFGMVRGYLKRFEPDVIVTVTESMNIMSRFYRRWGPSTESRWICRVGNNAFRELQDAFPSPWIQKKMVRFYAKSYQRASHILAISHGVKSMLMDQFGIDDHQISVIHNPVNVDKINGLSTHPSPVSGPYFVAIGRLSDHQKRIDILVDAYECSQAHQRHIPLYLIGKYQKSDPIYRDVQARGLGTHILFAGFQANPYVWMSHALAVVHTAEWEGFCSVIAEALACGTRVISTDCDFGPREILTPDCGVLTPVNDANAIRNAIDTVVREIDTLPQVSASATCRAREFDVHRVTNRYAQLVKDIYTHGTK